MVSQSHYLWKWYGLNNVGGGGFEGGDAIIVFTAQSLVYYEKIVF